MEKLKVIEKEALGGSKVGRQIVFLPQGVEFVQSGTTASVKGPKGHLSCYIDPIVHINNSNSQLEFTVEDKFNSVSKSKHGLYNRLVRNMVIGVSEGFSRILLLVGTGYRAKTSGNTLEMSLGYSHPVALKIPDGIQCVVEENSTKIILTGIRKDDLGQFAADIKKQRPVEPYKGKGVRYEGENVRKKAGKSGKK